MSRAERLLPQQRHAYGRPFVPPPDVPRERVEALRLTFERTMRTPAFLAEAEKATVDNGPVPAAELQELTERLFRTPPEVVARLRALLGTKVPERAAK